MRSLVLILVAVAAGGCFSASDNPTARTQRQDNEARLAAQRSYYNSRPEDTDGPFHFGRTDDPSEKRLDRGVPESSSTSPRNDSGMSTPPAD